MRSAHSRLSTGVVVLSLVLAACGVPAQADVPAATVPVPTSAAAVLPPAPTATTPPPSRVSQQPTSVPACTPSDPAAPAPNAPPLEAYSFSQPEVIFEGKRLGIAQWLPDNRRVLMTRIDPAVSSSVIETLDVTTREQQRFVATHNIYVPPIWLPDAQAVAFSAPGIGKHPALYLSYGLDKPLKTIATTLV